MDMELVWSGSPKRAYLIWVRHDPSMEGEEEDPIGEALSIWRDRESEIVSAQAQEVGSTVFDIGSEAYDTTHTYRRGGVDLA
ncbi:hypothetical protein FRC17_010294 [Serendipita sp. 399]|nr:hypothetical protein FRC17_010294 [Serendipita sp. 399]